MIEVRQVSIAVLFNLDEMYARKHSDPELIEAINSVLRVLNMILINRDSNWVVKETKLRERNGRATLPDDFAKMKAIYVTKDGETKTYDGEYRIVKDVIYIDESGTMDYFYVIPEVSTMEDEIDLPSIFLQLFIRYATGLIDGTFGKTALDGLISDEVDKLSSADNYPVIERPMQFYV
ncbi:hypothetical protein H6A05_01875 [Megasphaera elsdenii]|uniref:hypothetical protein n=1 Tax=Megasphaera elsdenii TaxID=907 RepID=UPI00195BEAD2|nr:hypothetical protein [Megasphaera elsdenii]MBM6701077.1 hypothetical protein [Megasphaera elsdenii]